MASLPSNFGSIMGGGGGGGNGGPSSVTTPASDAGIRSSVGSGASRPSTSSLPGSKMYMHEIKDPMTGKTFFANVTTGECFWEVPPGAVIVPKDPNVDEWWELFDENHKLSSILIHPYYYNTRTGETEWLKPSSGLVLPLQAIQKSTIGKRVSVIAKRSSIMTGANNDDGPFGGGITPLGGSPLGKSSSSNQNSSSFDKVNSPGLGAGPSNTATAGAGSPGGRLPPGINNAGANGWGGVGGGGRLGSPGDGSRKPDLWTSSPQLGASGRGSLNAMASENAWKAAKQGISDPVNNPDAAAAMNPLAVLGRSQSSPLSRTPTNPNLASLPKVKPEKILPADLQRHINQFRIDGFAKKYFAEHRKGIFRRKVPVEKMLLFQKDALKTPLMTLPKNLHKEALKCFKLIQKIMSDTSSGPPYKATLKDVQALLERGIMTGGLRDEIFVQVCKQLNRNPSFDQTFRGWILLCVIVTAFPPSKNFEDYMKSFTASYFDGIPSSWATDGNGIPKWAGTNGNVNRKCQELEALAHLSKFCNKKLMRICRSGPRGKVPALAEIERAQEAPYRNSLFGETLEDIMSGQAEEEANDPSGRKLLLPKILLFLSDAILNLNGCKTEGIFRVPGDIDMVNDLKTRIEKGNYDMTAITDPNVPSSLLKFWLRDLAEPLIPSERYEECIAIGHNEQTEGVGRQAAEVVASLPDLNMRVLLYMIKFLKIVGDPANHPFTKMTHANIARGFAPNVLRCPSDDPGVIFENTKYEQAFLRVLMTQSDLDGIK
ncbi:hypothetical protein HDU76_000932 [Blyttiomyces sp. JEL0837]|nr:hypothetical protein HDU76_000932 [Blyttiomyces sp. JEL0837]